MPRGALRATGIIFSTLRSAPKAHAARLSAKSGWIVSLSKIALRANHDGIAGFAEGGEVGSCPCQRSR